MNSDALNRYADFLVVLEEHERGRAKISDYHRTATETDRGTLKLYYMELGMLAISNRLRAIDPVRFQTEPGL